MPFGGDGCNDNSVMLTYTIKKGSIKIISKNQDFSSHVSPGPFQASSGLYHIESLYVKCLFSDGSICDMKFHIDTDPANLIPTLEAIDKQMLEAEEQNQFEIIKLKADSPNCTFST